MKKLREIAKETQEENQKRKKSNEDLFGKIWPLAKEEKAQGSHQTFEDYWKEHSTHVAEQFADLHGLLAECQKEGIEGLLRLTAMRTLTMGMLSQGYANTYEKTTISRGDMSDLQHAVYASTVGMLVTHDNEVCKSDETNSY